MSPVRERLINVIETLSYDIDEEILKRNTGEILKEIIEKYVETYGVDDLSENDKECIQAVINGKTEEK